MELTGEANGEPQKIGVALADIITGLYAAIAIEAAVIQRERTGKGEHIDLALLDSMVGVLANQAMNFLASGTAPTRMGNAHPNIAPYQVFPTSDGHFILAVGNDSQFKRFCSLIGLPALSADTRFATNAARLENRQALTLLIEAETAKRTKADLLAKCETQSVPAGPINRIDEVFSDPQVMARSVLIEMAEGLKGVRSPIRFSGGLLGSNLPAPTLGQHDQLLRKKYGRDAP